MKEVKMYYCYFSFTGNDTRLNEMNDINIITRS